MTDVSKAVQESMAQMEEATGHHYEKLQEAIAGIVTDGAPINRALFESLGSTNPEAEYVYEAQNLLASMFGSVDLMLNAQGVMTNPHKLGAVVVMAFTNYVQNMYQPCDCGDEDCDAVPTIDEIIFSLAHGRVDKKKPN